MEKIEPIKIEDRYYIDESGMDDNETNDYAWGRKGARIHSMKNAERIKRLSIIGALNHNNFVAPFLFEGSCDRNLFEVYLEKVLIPQLSPGKVVILDNASFHKGGRIAELIEKTGCMILYLPPYSPDLNPIERCWSPIKYRMRKALQMTNSDLYLAAELVFSN